MKFIHRVFLPIFLVSAAFFFCLDLTGLRQVSAYAMENNPDVWTIEASRALETNPQDAKAYFNRGTAYYGKEDYEAAIKDLSMSITLEPKAPDAYYNRGLSYRRQHKIDEAISDFTMAIQLYSGQPAYYFERCNALIVKNDFDGAVADCSEAIRLSPQEPEAYFLRGLAYMLKGNLDEALADSFKALQISPDYRDAKRLIFETLLKKESVSQRAHSAAPHKSVLEHKGVGIINESLT